MSKYVNLALALAMVAASAAAQSNVTTTNGGTENTVPVFTTGTNVENSPISVSGGNVGIGTTAPSSLLNLGLGGVNNGLRIGSYWELGQTAYMADAYFGINARLSTSDIPSSTNMFSPVW